MSNFLKSTRIRGFVKEALKNLIPESIIVNVIVEAKKYADSMSLKAAGEIKMVFAKVHLFTTLLSAKLPFPFSQLLMVATEEMENIIQEVIQEEYDEIKKELKEKGIEFIVAKFPLPTPPANGTVQEDGTIIPNAPTCNTSTCDIKLQ